MDERSRYLMYSSILHMKLRTVLGPRLAPVVEARRGDIRVAEPFLHFGDVHLALVTAAIL
jgi:hypothetical protein